LMPIIHRSNAGLQPSNTRTVDVVKAAIRDIMPMQQKKYANAFAVQGLSTLVYNLLEAGRPCSCSAKGRAIASRLNQEGKLPKAKINELITGGYEFKVLPYGVKRTDNPAWREETGNENQIDPDALYKVDDDGESQPPPLRDKIGRDASQDPSVRQEQNGGFGVNGPLQTQETIDRLNESAFDPDAFEDSDVSCPVCLGTGFISGAAIAGGWRQILVPQDDSMVSDGVINALRKPLSLEMTTSSRWTVTLPKGSWALDALRVWNGNQIIPATIMIDSTPITLEHQFLQFCDGRPHELDVIFSEATEFTHVELQTAISENPFRIEFPRITEGSDLQKLDRTEDVQIYASPEVPFIRTRDLLVESTYGKVFQITSNVHWNDTNQRLLGWDMNARVVQPQELFSLLPRRSVSKQKTTVVARSPSKK
jgi:hypothetical protein